MQFSISKKIILFCVSFSCIPLTIQSHNNIVHTQDEKATSEPTTTTFDQIIKELDQLSPEEQTAVIQQLEPEIQSALVKYLTQHETSEEELQKKLTYILNELSYINEHIVQVLNEARNSLRLGPINYEEASAKLISVNEMLNTISQSIITSLDKHQAATIIAIADEILKDIYELLSCNFKTIKPLNLDPIILRSQSSQTPDQEKITKSIQRVERRLHDVKEKTRYLGLSKSRRLLRKGFASLSRYRVIPRTALGAIFILGANHVLTRLDHETIEKLPLLRAIPNIHTFKDWIGDAPVYSKFGEDLTNVERLNPLSSLVHFLGQNKLNILNLEIPTLLTWGTILAPFSTDLTSIKMWTAEKWLLMINWLKGMPLDRKNWYGSKKSHVTFNDVIGKEEHKEVFESIIKFLEDPDHYISAGVNINLNYLLCGKTRTGKTFITAALAKELEIRFASLGKRTPNFISINPEVINAVGFDSVYRYAQDNGPSILFIDEIDMTHAQRHKNADMLSQMLTTLSGYETNNQDPERIVVLIAATNRPEELDTALLQSGRFGKILHFDVPTVAERKNYIARELHKRAAMAISMQFVENLAKETEGCTFADLHKIIIIALQLAKSDNSILFEHHLEKAFDRELRNIVKDEQAISWLSENQLNVMTAHLAGQTIINVLFKDVAQVSKITLYPIARSIKEHLLPANYKADGTAKKNTQALYNYGKVFRYLGNLSRTKSVQTHESLSSECKILLAGTIAQRILYDSASSYHEQERNKAFKIALEIVSKGIEIENLPKARKDDMLEKACELFENLENEVEHILLQHKEALEGLAQLLKEKKMLTNTDINLFLKKFSSFSEHNNNIQINESKDN